MKVAFVGLGSIGRRHLQNLHTVAQNRNIPLEVHAYRHSQSSDIPLVDKQYCTTLPQEEYDLVFITNPTSMHEESILHFQSHTKMMIIEKPIGIDMVDESKLLSHVTYYVNCPLRHTPVYALLQEHVKVEDVFAVRAICSSYLPNWRKNGDYRECYSAKAELGGGVELDLIHEMDYLVSYLGYPKSMTKMATKVSDLEITSHDFASYLMQYEDKVVELHLDYFGRVTKREMELYTPYDTYTLDFVKKELRGSGNTWKASDEDMYVREMNYIFDLFESKVENMNSISHANQVLGYSKM
ncbi:MAG: Gfo/Idh/MocA family oxidoreductase [Erysipelotrichaceae bacterium]|nr:Gfo/Idh/MocA family oxidoreductase [Erysipelotrichaceae bacterium]